MLTLFSTCKPMAGEWRALQENAIYSWTKLEPRPEILLIGNGIGVAQIARRYGCRYIPQVECNQWGTPLVGSVFEIAQRYAKHEQMCYVNADIILMQDFIDALGQVALSLGHFLAIAATWGLPGSVRFTPGWQAQLREQAYQLEPTGIDTFAFMRGSLDLVFPPIAIGRYGWDGWLPYTAQAAGIPVVDITASAMVLHQDHEKISRASDEVERNLSFTDADRGKSPSSYVWGADWYTDASGLHRQIDRTQSTWRRRNDWLRPGAITLFSVPHAQQSPYAIHQENAIGSWVRLRPRPEIILCGTDSGVDTLADKYSCVHCPNIEYSQQDTPIVSSVFEQSQNLAANDILCYVNTDIVLTQDFMDGLKVVSSEMKQFLMIGQRWDILISNHLRWETGWDKRLRARVREEGKEHAQCGIDYFAFRRGLYADIPPYILGRYWWDNALVLYALLAQRVPVVDASRDIMAIHQHHEHLPRGSDEEMANHQLYQAMDRHGLLGHTTESTHVLENGGLRAK